MNFLSVRQKRFYYGLAALLIVFGFIGVAQAQDLVTQLTTLLQVETLLGDPPPPEAAEELPGMGHKFELIGSGADAQDPDNSTNDVISTVLDPVNGPFFGGAIRRLPPGIKITALDNQINLKYRFTPPRSCGGGSPRISLFIDANGDGIFSQSSGDFVAQGHVNPPLFAACQPNTWVIEEMTDSQKRWETTPLVTFTGPTVCGPIGAVTTCTWDELEARVTATFPNHQVIAGGLIDDTFGQAGGTGTAHYDLITVENRTLQNRQDTVP